MFESKGFVSLRRNPTLVKIQSPAPASNRSVAQLARASVSKTEGWGFNSLLACQSDLQKSEEKSTIFV